MRRPIIRSASFVRAAKRYLKRHPQAIDALRETLTLLESDAFDPKLRTHKLKGELSGVWACSGGYDLRILFEFIDASAAESILLLTLGTHDEVY